MRTFSEFLNEKNEYKEFENDLYSLVNEEEKKELSDKQKKYQDLMLFGLAKFGATTPGELSKEDKTTFFNWLSDNWDKETGSYKNEKLQDKIDKAKEKGIMKENPAELSDAEKEKQKKEEAEKKKKEFAELMAEDD